MNRSCSYLEDCWGTRIRLDRAFDLRVVWRQRIGFELQPKEQTHLSNFIDAPQAV